MSTGEQQDISDEQGGQGLSQGVTTQEFQQILEQEISRAIEPVIRDLQEQVTRIIRQQQEEQEASGNESEAESPEPATSQEVFEEAGASLGETFVLLGRTVRALLETVRSLLRSVGLLLRALLTGIAQGLQAVWDAIQNAIRARIIQAIVDRVSQWVQALVQRVISWVTSRPQVPEVAES